MSRRSLIMVALVVAHTQAASTLKMMDESGREARITWKNDVLTVPQHCRESTCSSITQRQDALERRLASLETAQVSTLGLVQDLVAALSQHKGEAATDAELKQVKLELQAAMHAISLTPGPKGDRGRKGAAGDQGSKGEDGYNGKV